ncbi:phospholipase domain-containing protein [Streptomyces sp. NPDC048496]|uniref:phospholipase domain-containing protein n=1 Tax=Streptomyces sp. NPDC048496 TaxID=3365558 RepID=UPI0037229F61
MTDASGPWTYTAGSGHSLSGVRNVPADAHGAYDFTVHGPNGFLRRLAGRAGAAGPEVSARHDGNGGTATPSVTRTASPTTCPEPPVTATHRSATPSLG